MMAVPVLPGLQHLPSQIFKEEPRVLQKILALDSGADCWCQPRCTGIFGEC